MNSVVSIARYRQRVIRLNNNFGRVLLWTCLGFGVSMITWDASLELAAIGGILAFCLSLTRMITLGGFVSGPTFVILFIGLFHLSLVVPIVVFGALEPLNHIRSILYNPLLIPAVSLVTLGVGMFSAGVEMAYGQKSPSQKPTASDTVCQPAVIYQFWCLTVLLFGLLYVIWGFKQGVLFEDRTVFLDLKSRGESSIFGISRQLMIISTFVAVAFAPKRQAKLMAIILFTFLLPMVLAGKRGEFFVTVAALGVVFSLRGVRIPKPLVISSVVAVLAVIPILRRARGGVDAFATWYLDPFYEMGKQIVVVAYTIDAIKSGVTNWWYGASYLDAIWRVIPNIGDIRGTLIGGEADESPGAWLTNTYNPGGAGLGYSNIAEPYLNFGTPGVAAILFLIGYTLTKLERRAVQSTYVLAVYGALLSSVLWTARNDFYGVFRPLIWVMLGLMFTQMLVKARPR